MTHTLNPAEHVAQFADSQAKLWNTAAKRSTDPDDQVAWRSLANQYTVFARHARQVLQQRRKRSTKITTNVNTPRKATP